MPNGLTETQMVERMYTEMIGLDGRSGIVKDIEDGKQSRKTIHDKIDTLVTKTDCKKIRSSTVSNKRNRWLVIKDILLIVVGPAGGAGIIMLVLKYWGR